MLKAHFNSVFEVKEEVDSDYDDNDDIGSEDVMLVLLMMMMLVSRLMAKGIVAQLEGVAATGAAGTQVLQLGVIMPAMVRRMRTRLSFNTLMFL